MKKCYVHIAKNIYSKKNFYGILIISFALIVAKKLQKMIPTNKKIKGVSMEHKLKIKAEYAVDVLWGGENL